MVRKRRTALGSEGSQQPDDNPGRDEGSSVGPAGGLGRGAGANVGVTESVGREPGGYAGGGRGPGANLGASGMGRGPETYVGSSDGGGGQGMGAYVSGAPGAGGGGYAGGRGPGGGGRGGRGPQGFEQKYEGYAAGGVQGGRGGGRGPQHGPIGTYQGGRGPRPSPQGVSEAYGGRGPYPVAGGQYPQGRGASQPRGWTVPAHSGSTQTPPSRCSPYSVGSSGLPIPGLHQASDPISLQPVVTQSDLFSGMAPQVDALSIVEDVEQLTVGASATPAQDLSVGQSSQPSQVEKIEQSQELDVVSGSSQQPLSSKGIKIPSRPGRGTSGKKCLVKANHFAVELPKTELCQYNIVITPEVSSRLVNRAIIKTLVNQYRRTELGNRLPAYDGRKSLYTAGPLPFSTKEFIITLVDEDDGGPRRERVFTVSINNVRGADLYSLGMFLQGKNPDAPQDALQVLDIVLREYPTSRYVPVGRSFYSKSLGPHSELGDGLESWRGFYQSIRPTQMGLSLNIDMSSTAFIEPLPVVEFVCWILNKDVKQKALTDLERLKVKKALRGVKVEVTHRGNMRRKYRICGITSEAADVLTFPVDDQGATKTVTQYFYDTYGFEIVHNLWPCLQVGSPNRANYLPMEVCKIVEGQRYTKRLNDKQITKLLQVTCQRPNQRERDILNTVHQNAYDRDEYANEFGIKISNKLAIVEARVLEPPMLKYHPDGDTTDCYPNAGQWNMINKKMYNGGEVNNWFCINYSRLVDHRVNAFCSELAEMCNNSGMRFNPNPILPAVTSREPYDRILTRRVKEARAKITGADKDIDLLVFILPDSNGSLYGDLKRMCETNLGIISQCILYKHAAKPNHRQYQANVALKINVKVGGRNTVLANAVSRRIPLVSDKPTIIFGADVTHPHPGEDSSPSIAAVVASQDWPLITKYAGLVCAQGHRREIIDDLYTESTDPQKGKVYGGMIRELLRSFYKATERTPARIIFYRDGVSEGQFYQVLLYELDAIRKACNSLEEGYMPPVTFIVVQKRHHTRLFANDHNDKRSVDRSGNILPGTVVDTKICHPTEFDFYLCSHAGIQGTSRPAHYHVLWDENKFTADGLQQLTNDLCYTYARCTRSVSIVPPAYYAHLAAFRARHYAPPDNSETASSRALGRGGAPPRTTRGPAVQNAAVRPLPPLSERIKKVMFYC